MFHVLTDRNIGGAGRWLLNYLKHHDRETFDVWVVLPSDSALYPEVTALDVAVIPMKDMEDKSFDKKAGKALRKLFQEEKPDIVHTHASLTARMAAKKAGVGKIINTKHCMETAPGGLPKKIVRRMLNKRYSDIIIAVSKAVKRSMVAGGTDYRQIVTIYNGIDAIEPVSPEERAEILASYGGNPLKKAVGIVARLEEVKDHETFLTAAKEVLQQRQDIMFYVIGDGSLRASLEERAIALDIYDHVIFTGFVTNVEKIEAALDLNVITSKHEALCLSVIESMSAGIPAVGTDSGGVNEVICHEKNGYLVPVGDAKALAERILEVLAYEGEYRLLAENAKIWAREHFTAQKMTSRIERLYLEERK
ncbi:putative glycosyltransferase EpsD [Anaerotignum neopropionicum]|uniref:Putative glycosyltransferase EpsD n=1 Tax=Anaerotignum neopropionicum TaxID=36847 RepID=A0A136WBZ4_9FIRM|nr:putative glycosyltransferase EpsD [Anaerotignum neopropionicum]